MEGGAEDDLQVSRFYSIPITKPSPHTQASPSLQDTINELNMRRAVSARNGLDLSSEEISLGDESVQEERDEELEVQKPPHPAGRWSLQSHSSPRCWSQELSWIHNCSFCLSFLGFFSPSTLVSAGIVLTRVGYYTIPSMEELGKMLNENGECIVENFTVGRKGIS